MRYFFILLLIISPLYAVTLPHTFSNGEVADADQVNDNFNTLLTAINSSNVKTSLTVTGSSNLSGLLFPTVDGNNGDFLTTNGNGFLNWATIPIPLSLSSNEVIIGNWDNSSNPWADNEVDDALTINSGVITNTPISGSTGNFTDLISNQIEVVGSSNLSGLVYPSVDGSSGEALLTSGNGYLFWGTLPSSLSANDNVNLTGNWDNTVHPWEDNEVSDNLSINNGLITNTPISGSMGDFTSVVVNDQLDIAGGLKYSVQNISVNGIVSSNTVVTFADTSAQTVRLELPDASALLGQVLKVVKTSDNYDLEIFAGISGNINSGNLLRLENAFEYAELISNGSLWYLTSSFGSIEPELVLPWNVSDFQDTTIVTSGGLNGLTPLPYDIDGVLYDSPGSVYHAELTANAGYNAASGNFLLIGGSQMTMTFPSPISEFSSIFMTTIAGESFTIEPNNGEATTVIQPSQGVPLTMTPLLLSPSTNVITISWTNGEGSFDDISWR